MDNFIFVFDTAVMVVLFVLCTPEVVDLVAAGVVAVL